MQWTVFIATIVACAISFSHFALFTLCLYAIGKDFKPLDRALISTELSLLFLLGIASLCLFLAGITFTGARLIINRCQAATIAVKGALYLCYGAVFAIKLQNTVNCRTFRVSFCFS